MRSITSGVQVLVRAVKQVVVMTDPNVAVNCWTLASNTTPCALGSGWAAAAYLTSLNWANPGPAHVVQSSKTLTATLPLADAVCDVAVVVLPFTWVFV